MKKTLLLFIFFSLCIGSFAQQSTKKTTIVGQIEGLDNDMITIFSTSLSKVLKNDSDAQKDTIFSKGNRFEFQADENSLLLIIPKSDTYEVVNGNPLFSYSNIILLVANKEDKIEVKGKWTSEYIEYSASGTSFNYDYANLRLKYKSNSILEDKIGRMDRKLSRQPNSAKRDSLIESNWIQYLENKKITRETKMDFIRKNKDADLSAYLLTQMHTDTLDAYYPLLSENVRNGVFSVYLNNAVKKSMAYKASEENKTKIEAGRKAPDFTLKNQTGEDVTLSSLKGKYIVLDFWGTWCPPCMRGMSKMKNYYNKYKDNVEFVGIACDEKEATWKAAINKNDLNWRQLINDNKKTENDVSIRYAIQAFPTKIIIDKDMTILAVFSGETEHFYDKLDELMKQ